MKRANLVELAPLKLVNKTVYEVQLEQEILALHAVSSNAEEILRMLLHMYVCVCCVCVCVCVLCLCVCVCVSV